MLKIKSIQIKNFRSIVDEKIELDNYNIFVGLNDSGKSNVLKALNLFFNNQTDFNQNFNFDIDYSKFAKTAKRKAKQISISLEIEMPLNYSEKGTKTWSKTWRSNGLHSDNLSKLFKASRSKGAILFSRINYKYVPAVKSEEYFKTLLSDLYIALNMSANNELKIINRDYSSKLKDLTKELTKNIKGILDIESYIQMPEKLNTLFKDLTFLTYDQFKNGIDLNRRGDGIKVRHIPAILQFIQKNMLDNQKSGSIDYNFIWGCEEPENGLEYSACTEFSNELYKYKDKTQILVTTHSPAIYEKSDKDNVCCYAVYKNDQGHSKYETCINNDTLHNKVGIMPLIVPYISKAQEDLKQKTKEYNESKNEINKLKQEKDKIIIFTEGESDELLLNAAIEKLNISLSLPIEVRVAKNKNGDSGNSAITALLNALKNNIENSIIIGMYDHDEKIELYDAQTRKVNILNQEYIKLSKNIFAFAIPVPHNRSQINQISIEHYFTDDEIKTETDGKRLFLANEFHKKTRAFKDHTKQYYAKINIDESIKIIDSVTDITGENTVSISKTIFASKVNEKAEGFSNFDFSEFHKIFDVIKKIIKDAQN